MTEQELIEEGFEKIDVPVEESGDKHDYYYYQMKLSDDVLLTSNESDDINNGMWTVYFYDVNWSFKKIEDIQTLIGLHKVGVK